MNVRLRQQHWVESTTFKFREQNLAHVQMTSPTPVFVVLDNKDAKVTTNVLIVRLHIWFQS